jgi:hypothetical protein
METGSVGLGMVVLSLLVFVMIGGPAVVADWLRQRREAATWRQIAITDAIDSQFGPLVSPVVKNPMWGPWQVQIAVPSMRPGAVERILQLVDEVLTTFDNLPVEAYRIVLTPKHDAIHRDTGSRTSQSTASRLADPGLLA